MPPASFANAKIANITFILLLVDDRHYGDRIWTGNCPILTEELVRDWRSLLRDSSAAIKTEVSNKTFTKLSAP